MPEEVSPNVMNSAAAENSPTSAKKRRLDDRVSDEKMALMTQLFCPEKMHLVKVLRNDLRAKSIVLHARFDDSMDNDSIVILQKSSFPGDPKALETAGVVRDSQTSGTPLPLSSSDPEITPQASEIGFRAWEASPIMCNDSYHRLLVRSGLESVNAVDMTIIHPAEQHHFKRFIHGVSRIVHESPEMYQNIIVPFLSEEPRDLTWVQNICTGTSELDRVLFVESDPSPGFTFVQDYRWNGQSLQELHYLAIVHDRNLTCLRDLRASHIPLLRRIALEGRRRICDKYSSDTSANPITDDQLFAYLHYPPTFYWLHVHFVHVNTDDVGVRAGRAHILEEVIRNLELDSEFYAGRTITFTSFEGSPMWNALQKANSLNPVTDDTALAEADA